MWEEFVLPLVRFLFNVADAETPTAEIAAFFAWTTVFVFAGALIILFWKRRLRALVRPVPVILTSLGILGTFSGVFVALLGFNINDLENRDANFSNLLEGLKVAFSTSILGLFLAVVFRFFSVAKEDLDDISGKDLYELIDRGVKATQEATETFKSFADDLAKANKEQLLEALQEVIEEFNKALTAEVGKGFKELARAVDRLVEWQENYKKQMDELKLSLDASLEGISGGARDLRSIARSLAGVPENVKDVSRIIEAAHAHIKDMEGHLRTFAKLRGEISGVFPEIQKNIAAANAGIKGTVEEQIKALNKASDEVNKDMSRRVEQVNKDMAAQVENAMQELADYLSAVTKTQLDDFQGAIKGLREIVEEAEKARGDQG